MPTADTASDACIRFPEPMVRPGPMDLMHTNSLSYLVSAFGALGHGICLLVVIGVV